MTGLLIFVAVACLIALAVLACTSKPAPYADEKEDWPCRDQAAPDQDKPAHEDQVLIPFPPEGDNEPAPVVSETPDQVTERVAREVAEADAKAAEAQERFDRECADDDAHALAIAHLKELADEAEEAADALKAAEAAKLTKKKQAKILRKAAAAKRHTADVARIAKKAGLAKKNRDK